MVRAALVPQRDGAQWTGIATSIGERLLESGRVDAVLTGGARRLRTTASGC